MKQQKDTGLSKEGIILSIEQHKEALQTFGVKKIGLFGSFSSKRQRSRSDIDFLVVFRNTTFDNYMGLKFFLESLFQKKVDLVIEGSLKPSMKYVRNEAVYAKTT